MIRSSLVAATRIAWRQHGAPRWECLLVWLLCGAISAQSFLLPQPGALARFSESQRQSEEESDPVESPCEEQQGQLFAAPSSRDRSLHSIQRGLHVAQSATRGCLAAGRSHASLSRPAEMIRRNGVGATLRC
jgi:hypothetical protein